ncbi:hypothetical protein MesoLj113b_71870 (plasmid) [Mesorhizobium sp. 113-3-3]|nr:hypothetical protein MesoLj113b_71870 [Mesorhizobium sp. 113-3-3]
MKHQNALGIRRFDSHEPHCRSRHRLADRFRVGRIVLVALDVGLYVSRRHQLDHMPECNQLPRPMVRRRAGLHADEARLHIAKQRDKLIAPNFSTEHRVSSIIDAVNLKDVLGDIQSNRDNLHADGSFPLMVL